jgi:outer membrane protein, multidrug efflux system
MKTKFFSLLICIILISCTLEPKYQKPDPQVPVKVTTNSNQEKITTISWQKFFKSKELQEVIQLALDNNKDLKIANLNIESAQATNNIARYSLLPTINATGLTTRQEVPSAFSSFTPRAQYKANLSLASYEVDFFGRLRSLRKAALEDFLATKEAGDITRISLIAETANSYAQLLSDNEILEIATNALAVQQKKYDFVKAAFNNGIASKADLLDAQVTLENIKMSLANYQKIAKQDQNSLMLLIGVFNEASLPLKSKFSDIEIDEGLLNFIPSHTLLSRPDVKKAEHVLRSANADIGAARAAFFPYISLTGNYGYSSRDFSTLFSSKTWSFTPQINLPIFNAGKNVANLKIANLRKKIEIATYEKTIQTAFKEVLDELDTRKAVENRLKSAENILASQQGYYKIAQGKYEAGINSLDDALDAQLVLFSAKQDEVVNKKEYLANLISLYKVLGGGSEVVK